MRLEGISGDGVLKKIAEFNALQSDTFKLDDLQIASFVSVVAQTYATHVDAPYLVVLHALHSGFVRFDKRFFGFSL